MTKQEHAKNLRAAIDAAVQAVAKDRSVKLRDLADMLDTEGGPESRKQAAMDRGWTRSCSS